MNREEASAVLNALLCEYRAKSYSELQYLLEEQDTSEVSGKSGVKYQLEFQAVWNDKDGGDIPVIGAIDDGGWRAFAPLTEDFILSANGEFIGGGSVGQRCSLRRSLAQLFARSNSVMYSEPDDLQRALVKIAVQLARRSVN